MAWHELETRQDIWWRTATSRCRCQCSSHVPDEQHTRTHCNCHIHGLSALVRYRCEKSYMCEWGEVQDWAHTWPKTPPLYWPSGSCSAYGSPILSSQASLWYSDVKPPDNLFVVSNGLPSTPTSYLSFFYRMLRFIHFLSQMSTVNSDTTWDQHLVAFLVN